MSLKIHFSKGFSENQLLSQVIGQVEISQNGNLFVSYTFLIEQGVSRKTIETWSYRKTCHKVNIKGSPFMEYLSIPKPTLSKLPPESDLRGLLNESQYTTKLQYYSELFKKAYNENFLKFIDEYKKDTRLNTEQVTLCAKLRAVWEKVLECNGESARGVTELLYKAFNSVYKDKYSTYGAFCAVKTKARKDINSVVIDTRWFREQHSPIESQIQLWTKTLLSNPINNTAKSIWKDLETLCKGSNLKAPSYSWVKKFVRVNERNVEIYSSRNGKDKAFNNIEPYAKIIEAKHAGSQWQIDGWDLPFYYQGDYKGKSTSYLKLILLAVRDANSKKIVGYSVGESENTQTILEAIQDAVKNTNFLPFEIVSDNHSFNKTKEAEYFKKAIDSFGVNWTVSENPRRKAIAERYFRHLGETHCKKFDGYIGQGIKTKEKTGRPSQEYLDKFTKSGTWKTKEEIKLIAVKVVSEFNNTGLSKLKGKTPNEAHDQSEKPHISQIDLYDRLRLFTLKTELKICRGQINLTRAGITYEYQLNAEQFNNMNGQKVIVRYEDFSTIYLFDSKDRAIGSVKQKVGIHGALADQTQEDIEKLNRNKGRLNGIKAKARKDNEKLRDKVQAIAPDAFESLNKMTTPKDVLTEVRQNYELKRRGEELGIDLDMVEVGAKPNGLLLKSLQSKEKNLRSPFSVRDTHKVSVIDLSKDDEDATD